MENERNNRVWLPVSLWSIFAIINVVLQFLPLLKTFSYEFAAVNGLLIFTISLFASIYFSNNSDSTHFLYFAGLFIFPAVVSILTNKIFGYCPIKYGFGYYFLIVLPAEILGWSLGLFASSIFKNFAANILGLFFLVLFLFANFVEFYFYPQIYFFNQTFLFFPGTFYDNLVKITNKWYYFRVFTLGFSFLAFLLSKLNYNAKFKTRSLNFSFFLFVYLFFWFLKPYIGFSTNISRINNRLKGKISTEHFEIFLPDTLSFQKKYSIKLEHEFYYRELTSILKVKPAGKIRSFIFNNDEEKEELFGSKNADVTKPWLKEIFFSLGSYHSTLKHELVHAIAGAFGVTIFKVAKDLNPMLIEGLAVACSNNFDDYSIDYVAKMIRALKKDLSPISIFNNFKYFNLNSTISYSYAGSFIKFLLKYYGLKRVKELYRTGNFRLSFKKDSLTLQKEYFAFLDSIKIKINPNRANYYFGSKPIIARYCIRNLSIMREHSRELISKKKLKKALTLNIKIFEQLKDPISLITIANIYLKEKKYKNCIVLLENYSKKFKKTSFYPAFQLLLARAYYKSSAFKQAIKTSAGIILQNITPYFNLNAILITSLSKKNILTDTLNSNKKNKLLENLTFSNYPEFIFPLIENNWQKTKYLRNLLIKFANANKYFRLNNGYLFLRLARICESKMYLKLAKQFILKSIATNKNRFRFPIIKEELKKINFTIQRIKNERQN